MATCKTDSDELIAVQSKNCQLSLFVAEESPGPYWKKYRTPEQEAQFQEVLAKIRIEAGELLAIANELYPNKGWKKGTEVPTPVVAEARRIYDQRHPNDCPVIIPERVQTATKKVRLLVPWTLERKQRDRARRLTEKLRKEWTIPALYMVALQDAVTTNPQYFGVCPLPGAINSAPIVLPNLAKERAIARENRLRLEEAGVKPLAMPLKISQPDYEVIENDSTATELLLLQQPSHATV